MIKACENVALIVMESYGKTDITLMEYKDMNVLYVAGKVWKGHMN